MSFITVHTTYDDKKKRGTAKAQSCHRKKYAYSYDMPLELNTNNVELKLINYIRMLLTIIRNAVVLILCMIKNTWGFIHFFPITKQLKLKRFMIL